MKLPVFLGLCGFTLAAGMANEFILDAANSKVTVAVHATGDNFAARLERFETSIDVESATYLPTSGKVTWDFKDLKTAKAGRDKEMLHWLEYDQTPSGSFTVKNCGKDKSSGGLLLTGDLKIHNFSHEVTIPLTERRKGNELTWSGSVVLDYRDYGLPRIVKFAILKVDPALKVEFALAGKVKE